MSQLSTQIFVYLSTLISCKPHNIWPHLCVRSQWYIINRHTTNCYGYFKYGLYNYRHWSYSLSANRSLGPWYYLSCEYFKIWMVEGNLSLKNFYIDLISADPNCVFFTRNRRDLYFALYDNRSLVSLVGFRKIQFHHSHSKTLTPYWELGSATYFGNMARMANISVVTWQ